ncbi:sigma-54 interaction domain-containing protein [Pseudobacillus wudalianchiensis]|uniref:HTH-type transcriptional regulatory protein TyrR n=1 Tax=Pseudobacillus wudalianchiensis TaxID=1743143 RepID=A0A1B9AE10_9BACI|nr:sigma 54-interacting transcriptional regulator [Bacillus wudalianchiensis]OCA82089.1 Fis family transcriptional regulator [Bacillus wudalianchiensis]
MDLREHAFLLLKHILDHSFDEIFIADNVGNILHVSGNTEKIFGIPPEKFINQNIFALEEEGIFSPSIIATVLRNERKETFIQETIHNRKLIISGYPVYDDKGALLGALSFSRDITEFEYLKKENEQVAKAMQLYQEEIKKLKQQAMHSSVFKKGKMEKVFDTVLKVSDLGVTVLLEGESGVGKTRIAQIIHEMSKRKNQPFIEVNCGAIPESLIESELFGYEEGAFTGAKKGGKKGYFETAGEGTLLLDEIGELPMNLQVKLLTVLQNQSLVRVGGSKKVGLKCRIICATNQNLEEMIKNKQFREDLYYRINVIKMTIPPLRERRDEIVPLVFEITEEMNLKYGMNKHFTTAMVAWISQQEWPGNVRELRNFIEKKMITTSGNEIDLEMNNEEADNHSSKEVMKEMTLQDYMETVEKEFILRMYQQYPSSVKIAKKLGISQSTANRKIRKYIGEC